MVFYLNFDRLERATRDKGMTLKKIDTVYEGTPEFEALWAAYVENPDPLYNICTEPDGKTHTFYRIYLDASNNDNEEADNG